MRNGFSHGSINTGTILLVLSSAYESSSKTFADATELFERSNKKESLCRSAASTDESHATPTGMSSWSTQMSTPADLSSLASRNAISWSLRE